MNDKLGEVLKGVLSLQKELKEELERFRAEARRGFDGESEGFKTTGRMSDSLSARWENNEGFPAEEK